MAPIPALTFLQIESTWQSQHNRLLTYLIVQIVGGPNKQEFWFRRMHLKFICLACESSETDNLQRVFRPEGGGGGGSPLHRLYRYVPRQRVCFFFFAVLVWNIGYQFRPSFWSEIGYGLCNLVLNWVCFLEQLATSLSLGDKAISLLMVTPTTVYVP